MRFKEIFEGDRFAKLRDAGASVQRPLWASTGVKNPHYPDTKYVDALVAPHTVNTMPMPTLLAAGGARRDHGRDRRPGPERRPEASSPTRGSTWTTSPTSSCARASTRSSSRSTALLDGVEQVREAIVTGRPATIKTSIPDDLEPAIADKGREAKADNVAQRVWRKDDTLWGEAGAPEVADRLGWLTISEPMLEEARGPRGVRRGGEARRPDRLRAARHGRLEPGARGDQALVRPARARPAAARARLDRPRRGRGARAQGRPVEDALPGLVEVGRHGRDAVALPLLLREDGRQRVAVRCDHRPGQPAAEARRGARLPARLRERPRHRRPLLGAVVLRDRAGRPDGREHPRRSSTGARSPSRPARTTTATASNSGLWLGIAMGALALERRDKLDVRRLRPDLELRAVGRAADRGVDRQGGQGHPSGGRRAARRRPTSTATTACSHTCATPTRPTRRPTPRSRRWRARDTRCSRSRRTGRSTWAGSSSSPSSRPRSRAGRSASTRSTSRTSRRRRTTPGKVLEQFALGWRAAGGRGGHRRGAARAARRRRAAELRGDHGLRAAVGGVRRGGRRAARRRSATRRGARRRSGTGRASCTRPASSTRAGRRRVASSRSSTTADEDIEVPEAGYTFGTLKNAQATGDLQTLRAHGLPAERVRLEGDPVAGAQTTDRADKGVDRLMQLGFVGLGRMGGNMVHRIHRDSDHECVAFDFSEDAVKEAESHGASRRVLARGPRVEARRAARGVGHGAGRRPDHRDRQQARRAARLRATRSSTAATAAGPTTRSARPRSSRRASTTWTSARAAASGASRSATA